MLTLNAVENNVWVRTVRQDTVTHMAGKEVEAYHHDNDHHGHEVLGGHYGCSGDKIEAE